MMNKVLQQPNDNNVQQQQQQQQQASFVAKKESLLAMSQLLANSAQATSSSSSPSSSPSSGTNGGATAGSNNAASTETTPSPVVSKDATTTSHVTCSSPDSTMKAEIPADLRFPDFVDFGYPDFNEIASLLGNVITGQEPTGENGPAPTGAELASGMMAKVDSSGMLSLEVPSIGGDCSIGSETPELAALQPLQTTTTTTTTSSSADSSPATNSPPSTTTGGASPQWLGIDGPGTPKSVDSPDSAWNQQQQQRQASQQQQLKSLTGSHLKDLLMGSSCVYQKNKPEQQSASTQAGGVGNSSLLQLLRSGPAFTPQQQMESHRASMTLAGFANGLNNALRGQQGDVQGRNLTQPSNIPHLLQHPTPSTTSTPPSNPPPSIGAPKPGQQPLVHATKSRPLPNLTKVTVNVNNDSNGGFPGVNGNSGGLPTSKTSFGPNVQAPRLSPTSSNKGPILMSPVSTTHPGMKNGLTNVVSSGTEFLSDDHLGNPCSTSTASPSSSTHNKHDVNGSAAAMANRSTVSSSGLPGTNKQKNRTRIPNSMKKEGRLHPCTVCTKSFKDRFSLEAHFRIHTGERPFKCGVCGKGFKQKAHMQKHATMHLGVGRVGAPPPRIRRDYSRPEKKRKEKGGSKKPLPSLNNNAMAAVNNPNGMNMGCSMGSHHGSGVRFDPLGLGGLKMDTSCDGFDGIQYNTPGGSAEAFSDPSVSTTTLESGDDHVGCGSTDLKSHLYSGELYRRLTSQTEGLANKLLSSESLFDSSNNNGALDYLTYADMAPYGQEEVKPNITPMDTSSSYSDTDGSSGVQKDDGSPLSMDDFNYAAMSPIKDFLEDLASSGVATDHHMGPSNGQLFNPLMKSPFDAPVDMNQELRFLVGDVSEDPSRRLLVTFYRLAIMGSTGDPEDDAYQCQVCRQLFRGKDDMQEHAKTHYRPPSPACLLPTPGPGTTTVKLEDLEHLDAPGNVYYAA